ncbi:MAG TPA: hypothetical protein VE888_12155 [Streptosporangiaceae bacterium]|nr:hypothetical protein [Streptosporangiaceae bacterium]
MLESAYGRNPAYQQPAVDDFGYGDPGYSDPSYEGPKAPYGNSPFPAGNHGAGHHGAGGTPRDFGGAGYRPAGPSGGVPGYQVPEVRDPSPPAYQAPRFPGSGYQPQSFSPPPGSGQDIWPVTGAQAALPDTGPQPALRDGSPRGGGASSYPEEWYGSPRLNDRASDDVRPSRSSDPRLAGMTYGELRYDEPEAGESGYVEPLDEESWYQELRRSAPAYPQTPGGPQGPGSGPQRRAEPSGPAFGQQSGYSPGPDRAPGFGQPRRDGSGPQTPQGPQGPQMSAGRPQPGPAGPGGQAGPAAAPGAGFISAPVGLLTPPNGTRVDSLRDPAARPAAPAASPRTGTSATQVLTGPKTPKAPQAPAPKTPGASRPGAGTVRPGHGLDGPEITSSWPAQPAADDHPDSYQDFWRDDADEEYTGLFGDREAEFERADAKLAAAKRRIGRRRGGSNDHRLWLGLGGVIVIAAAAIVGVIKFEFPSHSGPAHTMTTPDKIGTFARTVDLEHQADVAALKQKVISMSSGQASHVVSAVYESGKASAGNTAQIIMFIGGHLANADPAASITSFTQQFRGAKVVTAGGLGGKAACVQDGTGSNSVAMCAWFDNDSFGEVVSPTMNASALATAMHQVRPAVEQVSGK